jgi:DNA repair exonuclease SbcCD nuclease subunit
MTSRLSQREARERKRELTESFRRMTEEAARLGACGIIIAGDLFDNERVSVRTLDSVMGIIENATGITFFYLPGNHERNRLSESGVKIPENLVIFGSEWTSYRFGDITVSGCTEIKARMFSSLTLDEDRINIAVLHGELADRTQTPDKIGIKELENTAIDYLALGHYHSYSETPFGIRGRAVYSGTPEGRGFDETGDKGYVLIDTDSGAVTSRFVKRAVRTLRAVNVDVGGADREIEIENRVAHAVSQIPRGDLVRVILVGEHEPGVKRDLDALSMRFADSFFHFEIKDTSRMRISGDDYKNDRSLKGEFIRLVLGKEELTEKEKEAIIECGIRALAGDSL